MFSNKLSHDFKIKVQHQNFANKIKFKKKKKIGRNILQYDNQHYQKCNIVNYAKIEKPKQYTS
jgi:hypothetical protein